MSEEYHIDLHGFEKWLTLQKKQPKTIDGYCGKSLTFSNIYAFLSKENIREFEETLFESEKSKNTINAYAMLWWKKHWRLDNDGTKNTKCSISQ